MKIPRCVVKERNKRSDIEAFHARGRRRRRRKRLASAAAPCYLLLPRGLKNTRLTPVASLYIRWMKKKKKRGGLLSSININGGFARARVCYWRDAVFFFLFRGLIDSRSCRCESLAVNLSHAWEIDTFD